MIISQGLGLLKWSLGAFSEMKYAPADNLPHNKAMKCVHPLRGCTGQFALRSNCRLWQRYAYPI